MNSDIRLQHQYRIPKILRENSLESMIRDKSPNSRVSPVKFRSVDESLLLRQEADSTNKFVRNSNLGAIKHHTSANSLSITRNSVIELNCANCAKLEKQVEILKVQLAKLTEKKSLTEKHLKQYESLLKIKENRLKEKETALNTQNEHLTKEKEKVMQVNELFHISNGASNNSSPIRSLFNTSLELKNLNGNVSELLNIRSLNEYDFRRTEMTDQKNLKELELKLNDAHAEIDKLLTEVTTLKEKHLTELKTKSDELEYLSNLAQTKSIDLEDCQNLLEHEKSNFARELQVNEELRDKLASQESKFQNELQVLSQLLLEKSEELSRLKEQKGLSNSRRPAIKKVTIFGQPLRKVSFDNESISPKASPKHENFTTPKINFDSPEPLETPLYYDSQESPNKITQASLKWDSPDSDDLKTLKSKLSDLEIQFFSKDKEIEELNFQIGSLTELNKNLNQKIESISQENDSLQTARSRHKDKINNLKQVRKKYLQRLSSCKDISQIKYEELNNEARVEELIVLLEQRLNVVIEKEKRLEISEAELLQQEDSIITDAECLKMLHEDLKLEKSRFVEEKKKFAAQKVALLEISKKQQEKDELLDIKEKEMFKLKEELIERERIICQKLYRMPLRNLKRMSTHLSL